jgi:nitrogen regulatory protein PII-like uncharacterized protein
MNSEAKNSASVSVNLPLKRIAMLNRWVLKRGLYPKSASQGVSLALDIYCDSLVEAGFIEELSTQDALAFLESSGLSKRSKIYISNKALAREQSMEALRCSVVREEQVKQASEMLTERLKQKKELEIKKRQEDGMKRIADSMGWNITDRIDPDSPDPKRPDYKKTLLTPPKEVIVKKEGEDND